MARAIWTGPDERGRLAPCLIKLYDQLDAMFPLRDHKGGPDGSIGDERHQAQKSEHNPDDNGIVRAIDITNDPAHGLDARRIAQQLIDSRDDRILYIISNRQICRSYDKPGIPKWSWAPYTLSNPHEKHFHISVVDVPVAYNDTRPWKIDPVKIENSTDPNKFTNIKATVFFDARTAYPPFSVSRDFLGYSLPGRIQGELPLRITNRANGMSVIANKADIGPWYDGRDGWPEDRWWETNTRPRAEVDSRTNGAGIDLLVATAKAIGINVVERDGRIIAGEAQVDVEIVGKATKPEEPMATEIEQINAAIKKINDAVLGLAKQISEITSIFSQIVGQVKPTPIVINPEPVEVPPEKIPALEKPGVATSIGALAAALAGIWGGKIGTPFGMGEMPTDAGTASIVGPLLSMGFGMAGGWRGILQTVLPAIVRGGAALIQGATGGEKK